MKLALTTIVLVGSVAVSAFAADAQNASAMSCADYTALSEAEQVKSIELMISEMPEGAMPKELMSEENVSMDEMGSGGTAGGVMGTDTLMSNAKDACSANPDVTVGEALKMMQGS